MQYLNRNTYKRICTYEEALRGRIPQSKLDPATSSDAAYGASK